MPHPTAINPAAPVPMSSRSYAPTWDELAFGSFEEGVAYAQNALFEVKGKKAHRDDMPGVEFYLSGANGVFHWKRSRDA